MKTKEICKQKGRVSSKNKQICKQSRCMSLKNKQICKQNGFASLKNKQLFKQNGCVSSKNKKLFKQNECVSSKNKQLFKQNRCVSSKNKKICEQSGCVCLGNREKCEFTVHPCNFKVQIREVKPFLVYACKFIILDLKVINHCNVNSIIKIKSTPRNGQLFFLSSSTVIYKSTKRCCGLDFFQLLVKDECGGKRTETILIRVI